ncbi:hypothetical protein IV203_028520 [Nitzschia inconspicua]|uniref:Uncharacterized protein n=1 Tax=Nitzschia inconspicua TaxID=303405 RepID=A0A9K3LPS2_9STRA|nr:hypothetical protein IV203_028520 [Nitzschia inconspicua]
MSYSIPSPVSPLDGPYESKFFSEIPESPPSLDSMTSLSSSLSSNYSSTSFLDSSVHDKLYSSNEDGKSVRFVDVPTVRYIENALHDWTVQEQEAVWYTSEDLRKQRHSVHQLARTMEFYSDDDLMDRFGILSVHRQEDRMAEVGIIVECVENLHLSYGMTFWDNTPLVVTTQILEERQRQQLLQRYYLVTQLSRRLAVRRASKLAKSLQQSNSSNDTTK